MIGQTLGHYRVIEKIGAGAMGEVYAAEDTKLRRRVALKLLPGETAASPERLNRFQREARAVAALNHPNIVTLYSVEEAEGVHFLTMELVEGKTLAEIIPPGGLPLDTLLKLAGPLVDAVAAAHEQGIVHRDLKPANIMVAEDGRLKVLDFGLAKLKPEASSGGPTSLVTQSTESRVVVGTAAYMSPEQAEGRPVDYRTDIFSLGVILYEMACGRRPFGGETILSIVSSILRDTPPPVSAANRAAPPALERIITRALAKDPAGRYQRAAELGQDLQLVHAQSASRRVAATLIRAVARSRPMRRVALGTAILGVVSAAAWFLVPWRARPAQGTAPAFTQLTVASGIEQFPSFTPDGKEVVYASQQSGNWDIYRQPLESTGEQPAVNLTANSPDEDNEPAVSLDGRWIAFRSSRDGGGIFVMSRTGEGPRRVTPAGVSNAFNPTWSPDGTEIAYTTEDVQLTPLNWERRSELRVVSVSMGEQRTLEVNDAVKASWSPRGHRIAYAARPRPPTASEAQAGGTATRALDIWTVPAKGGEPVAVTNDPESDWSPAWSADGRYVYFGSNRGGSWNLWRVAIDEASGRTLGDPQPVTTPATFAAHPALSADGRLVAYCAKMETGNIQKLTLDPATASVVGEPSWITTGSQAFANPDPTWDGEWVVAYTREQPEGDLWVIRADGTGTRRQLTSDAAIDRVPRWSPDKTWIAYFSTRDKVASVWKTRFDGSGRQQVVPVGSVAVWSPDGTRMAFGMRLPGTGAGQRITYVIDPGRPWEAQTPEQLPPPDKPLQPFIAHDWSRDRARLAGQIDFTAGRGDGIVIYTFSSRTYELVSEFGEWPVWLPDSRRVLFVYGGREYWVVDTRTKQKQKIYSVPRGVLGPARLTRDGRTAFFPLALREADIWVKRFE